MMGPAVAALPTASTIVTEQPVKPAVPSLCLLLVLAAACGTPAGTSDPVAVETVTEVVTETVADAAEVSATAEPTAAAFSCEGALPSQECVEQGGFDEDGDRVEVGGCDNGRDPTCAQDSYGEPESDRTDPGSDCEGVPDELCDADFSDVVPVEPATCGPAEYATIDALAAESQRLQSALFDIPAPYSGGVTGPSTGQDYNDYGNQQQATMDLRMDLNAAKSDVDQQLAALRQDCADLDAAADMGDVEPDVGQPPDHVPGAESSDAQWDEYRRYYDIPALHGTGRPNHAEVPVTEWSDDDWDQFRLDLREDVSDAEWDAFRRRTQDISPTSEPDEDPEAPIMSPEEWDATVLELCEGEPEFDECVEGYHSEDRF